MVLELRGHDKDLGGGLRVHRLLPALTRRTVGPFVFLDHLGPLDFTPGMNTDVRAHPHIGLATVTYLFEGAMLHRDSLGSVQRIEPGAINWMSAGRGIVHSERTPPDLRALRHQTIGHQPQRIAQHRAASAWPNSRACTHWCCWAHSRCSQPQTAGTL